MSCKISIITITYNSSKTVEETIKSVISQDYADYEYIIIDGGSTDGTIEIVNKYMDKISYFVSEKDNGICDAFNKGIVAAKGDIVGIINSDDMLYPGALQSVAKAYEIGVDIIYGNGIRLYENGKQEAYVPKPLKFMKYGMALVHPSTFVTKKAYEKYGTFDSEYKGCMDRELILRMQAGGAKFKRISDILSIYRMGGFSDENYLKVVAKERDKLSIMYGANPVLVYFNAIKVKLKMKLKSLVKN